MTKFCIPLLHYFYANFAIVRRRNVKLLPILGSAKRQLSTRRRVEASCCGNAQQLGQPFVWQQPKHSQEQRSLQRRPICRFRQVAAFVADALAACFVSKRGKYPHRSVAETISERTSASQTRRKLTKRKPNRCQQSVGIRAARLCGNRTTSAHQQLSSSRSIRNCPEPQSDALLLVSTARLHRTRAAQTLP